MGDAAESVARLAARRPFAAAPLLAYLAARAIPGVEEVEGRTVRRALSLPHAPATVALEVGAGGATARLALGDPRDREAALAACRALLDLDAEPLEIDAALARDAALAPLVAAAPGLRSPGAAESAEVLFRAIAGQQVSVAAARTVLGRLAREHGESPAGARLRPFPSPERLASVDPGRLPMPRARARALVAAASALARGDLVLDRGADREAARRALLALPGIGPWTASYVAMRALGDPDVLMVGDLGLDRGLAALGLPRGRRRIVARAASWRPWRSYATHHLWRAAAGLGGGA